MQLSFARSLLLLGSAAGLVAAQAHGEAGAQEMGPMAFLWPSDREWSDDYDQNSPCGSPIGATTRTEFPLTDGAVALVMQNDTWNIDVNIYYGSGNPTSVNQFSDLLPNEISALEAGHMCYYVPDQTSDAQAGSNATIEIIYTGVEDDKNTTLYACADITFVSTSSFNLSEIPCFNVTYSSYYASLSAAAAASASETAASSSHAHASSSMVATSSFAASSAASSAADSTSTEASSSSAAAAVNAVVVGSTILAPIAAIVGFFLA
ncbi:uncharacterized protein V1516DRAFT_699606 [Lipomyces oligophaga]|uniref:uncharacterized protein n=1 Tax=Lipomyces oligophaga TaxID=45792 RepID=UPI0034CE899B